MHNKLTISVISILAISLFGTTFAQSFATSPAPAINGTIILNATVPNLELDLPMLNFSTPVSQGEFLTGTDLHVSILGASASNVTLSNPDFGSLAPMGVNVMITPNRGTAPFIARVFIGVTPATASGTYNITVDATGSANSTTSAVISLTLMNPSNHTFLYSTDAPSKAQAEQELANLYATSVPTSVTTSVPQQPQQEKGGAFGTTGVYVVVAAIAAIAAAYLFLRKRK